MPAASSLEPVDSALKPSVLRSSCTKQTIAKPNRILTPSERART